MSKIDSKARLIAEDKFGLGEPNTAFSEYFEGQSYLKPLSSQGVPLFNVTFEPGCRNNWHIHEAVSGGGQILICTAGEGWYCEEGKEPLSLKAGMVVNIPVGVKHWHGAKKDSWFSHIAAEVPGESTSTKWCEKVGKDYDRLPKSDSCVAEEAAKLLYGETRCVILGKSEKFLSDKRGIAPIIEAIDSGIDFSGCIAADRIVGKAAALLYAHMGASEIYASVLGRSAVNILKTHNIKFEYGVMADYIRNRDNTGMCPMEETVLDITEPAEALKALKIKLAELRRAKERM